LTSDVAALGASRTQWSGYCSPQGRLLATCLVWRIGDDFLLQLPQSLRDTTQSRLARYVLRARVTLTDAGADTHVFGVWGDEAPSVVSKLAGAAPGVDEIISNDGVYVARLPIDRFVILARSERAENVRAMLGAEAIEAPESVWSRLDIEAGVPMILPEIREQYIPQMLNLDLIGGLSYGKGCYPGQEIVARTHYLGRLKQRMYRIHVPGSDSPAPGDALYSPVFGPEQASGGILYAAPSSAGGFDALAVIQTSAARSADLCWRAIGGPRVQLEALPYRVPDDPAA
jgi:folate-binding protein YgfZ